VSSITVKNIKDARCPKCGSSLAKSIQEYEGRFCVECVCGKSYTVTEIKEEVPSSISACDNCGVSEGAVHLEGCAYIAREEEAPTGIPGSSWDTSKCNPLADILALKKMYQEETGYEPVPQTEEASEIVGRIADKAVTMEDCLSILAKRKPGENPHSLIHSDQFTFLVNLGYVTEHGQLTETGRKKLEEK
jgi:hypothetical protein